MERLTTDYPRGNLQTALNFATVKDGEVMLHWAGGEYDVNLCEYLSKEAEAHSCDQSPEAIRECVCFGCDDASCHVKVTLALAIQATEMRCRLKMYEDKYAEEIRRSSTDGKTCGDCKHFIRTPGTAHGVCAKRKYCLTRRGTEDKNRLFRPSQSRMACKRAFELNID